MRMDTECGAHIYLCVLVCRGRTLTWIFATLLKMYIISLLLKNKQTNPKIKTQKTIFLMRASESYRKPENSIVLLVIYYIKT